MVVPRVLFLALLSVTLPAAVADTRTDRAIEETARSSYTFRRVLNNTVTVNVHDGVATLNGRVRDADQSRLAEDTVAGIDGVRRVNNQVKLDPQAPEATDEWLAVKIRSRLLLKPELNLSGTGVEVKGGVVTLTGAADSDRQKELTEATVKSIAGVRAVRNHLEVVERSSSARTPANDGKAKEGNLASAGAADAGLPTGRPADDAPPNGDTRAERIRIEDEAITTQIEFELLVNKETGGLKTKVETQRGRVTISGEAQSERQRELISRLANRVGGVVEVDNQVVVRRR